MSKWAKTDQPCPDTVGCGSSDGYAIDKHGDGYCFSCQKPFHNKKQEVNLSAKSLAYLPWGAITADTMRTYGVSTVVGENGQPLEIAAPFEHGTQFRNLLPKGEGRKYRSEGDMSKGQLFGADRFSAGSAQAITITEGWRDALSVFQMQGSKYPAVSIRSASTAVADCTAKYDYINSFEKIYLCFDADKAGESALMAAAALFDFNKVYHVKMSRFKDANEYLEARAEEEFRKLWWNAGRFLPDQIISSYADIDDLIDNDEVKEGISYPWPTLQQMTYGMRPGEVILLTAQEGIGKTEFIRAIEHHVLKTTDPDTNIGIIHLEEPKARTIKGLVGYELEAPVHLPDSQISKDQIKDSFRKLTKKDNRVHLYSHFGSDDYDVILGMVQFLAGPCQCKFIFLDHISMVVSGSDLEDERRALDIISTRLAMLAEKLGITLVMVSHVNDDGLTRGSRNISKVAHLHVHLDRDKEAIDPQVRNTTSLMIRKNRFGAHTGPAGKLHFDINTFMLKPEEESFGIPVQQNEAN
jgi:twinkle protein